MPDPVFTGHHFCAVGHFKLALLFVGVFVSSKDIKHMRVVDTKFKTVAPSRKGMI